MIDEHTIKVLEFKKIREMVADRAVSELGREEARRVRPGANHEAVARSFEEISELKESILSGDDLPLTGLRDIRTELEKARISGSALRPEGLAAVASILRAARLAKKLFRNGERFARLFGLTESIVVLLELESEIERSIDPQGEILDTASRRLGRIRSELESCRQEVHDRLAKLAGSKVGDALQEKIITIRDGRYVVPVKGSERSRIKGIVHDVSASGATVFVEPLPVVEGNNRLRQLACEEEDEIARILVQLTSHVGEAADAIEEDLQVLKHLDLRYGQARLSIDLDCIAPEMNEEGQIDIRSGRHPLLLARPGDGSEVVPLDVRLGDEDALLLLLTGPNTGGKTVALKTVGLLTLMAQAGLHVPAKPGTRLALFQSIYADIGDEQSIEESLSTFSSHLQQIVKILDEADQRSLVLLDEVGVGTDPVQGAALAMAVMEELVERSARVVATTHYGSLKAFAHDRHGMENAAMEFDPETLRPTYRVRMGVPGSSNAFIIARRLGMPPEVAEKAQRFVDSDELRVDDLLVRLEHRVAEAEEREQRLGEKERELDEMLDRYRKELGTIDERRRNVTERAREEARDLVRQTKAQVEELVREIRESGAAKEVVQRTHRELNQLSKHIEPTVRRERHRPLDKVAVGQSVRVRPLDSIGIVRTPPDDQGRVEVELGGMRLHVSLGDLGSVRQDEGAERDRPRGGTRAVLDASKKYSVRLDLRGLYIHDIADKIDKFIDDAQVAGLATLRIVHGKGTGALRKEVERVLRNDVRVREYHLAGWNEGGTGVTVVSLARDHEAGVDEGGADREPTADER